MRAGDDMSAETAIVDMTNRTVNDDGETLPVVWWGDGDKDPCPLPDARFISAGPDRNGLYLQIDLGMTKGRVQ